MHIIALMNQKGGVGKTTTTVNLGAALAELGRKICLIDLDPQAHLTINYGVEPTSDLVSLYNVLVEERPILDAVKEIDGRISLIPSSIDLAAAEIELVSVLGREMLLKKRIAEAGEDAFDFDYVLLDCPPSLGLLTLNALAAATDVLIPMQPHFLALQGVAKLLETVQLVGKRMNPHLKVMGISLTMYDSQTKLSGEVVNELNGFIEAAKGKNLPWSEAKVFKSRIRRNIKLAESPSFGQHIIRYDPGSNGAADYRALARELLEVCEAGVPLPEKPVVDVTAPPPPSVAVEAMPMAAVVERQPVAAAAPPEPPPAAPPVEVSIHAVDPTTRAAAKPAKSRARGTKKRPATPVVPIEGNEAPPSPDAPEPDRAEPAPAAGGGAAA